MTKITTDPLYGIRVESGRVTVMRQGQIVDITAELIKSKNFIDGRALTNVYVTTDQSGPACVEEPQRSGQLDDFLMRMFRMQEELNDMVFVKQRIPVFTEDIRRAAAEGRFGPNDLPNQWLRNYLRALQAEAVELENSLLWKWWSKDKIDMQNVRVEIMDMFHFLVSLALVADLNAAEVMRLYTQKWEINKKRQQEGYSQATKTEADNKTVK